MSVHFCICPGFGRRSHPECGRCTKACLGAAAAEPQVTPLGFIECVRYDEATKEMRVRQDPELDAGGALTDLPAELQRQLLGDVVVESAPARLFQTESQWAALLRIGSGASARFVVVRQEVVMCPQVLQRNSADVIAQALGASSPIRLQALEPFGFCVRQSTSDRAAAQASAERIVMSTRPGWRSLRIACEIHNNTGSLSKALKLMDPALSGIIRLACSLRLGGWMKLFRQALFEEIFSSLVFREVSVPREAVLFRKRALAIFVGPGRGGGKPRRCCTFSPMGIGGDPIA